MKTCRICGIPLNLKADTSCPQEWVNALASMPMCCNRCGDYGWSKRQIHDLMLRACSQLQSGTLSQEVFEKRIRLNAESYVKAICKYHRVPLVGASQLADAIIGRPDLFSKTLREFEDSVQAMKPQPVTA